MHVFSTNINQNYDIVMDSLNRIDTEMEILSFLKKKYNFSNNNKKSQILMKVLSLSLLEVTIFNTFGAANVTKNGSSRNWQLLV